MIAIIRKHQFAILLVAAFLALRLVNFDMPLWYDEQYSYLTAAGTFGQLIASTATDVHPPLGYIPQWLAVHAFPTAPLWIVRVPSLLFSLVSLWLFARILTTLELEEDVRKLALAIYAIAPYSVFYAQEARMYALLQLLALWAFYESRRGHFGRMALAMAGMLYTQNYGLFYSAVIGLAALYMHPAHRGRIVAWGAAALAAYTPWALVVARQMSELQLAGYWIPAITSGYIGVIMHRLVFANTVPQFFVLPNATTYYAVALIAVWVAARGTRSMRMALVMALAPIALAITASVVWSPILLHRPLIGAAPWWYVVLAAGLLWAWQRTSATWWLRLPFAAGLLVMLFSSPYYLIMGPDDRGDYAAQKAYAPLADILQPGDVLWHSMDGSAVPFAADKPQWQQYTMPLCSGAPGYLTESTRNALGLTVRAWHELPRTGRVFVLYGINPFTPQCERDYIDALLARTNAQQVYYNERAEVGYFAVYMIEAEHVGE